MHSIRSLRRRKRRVILSVVGVAFAIALTVTMLSIGEGLRSSTDALVRSTGVDLFIVPRGSDYIFLTSDFTDGTELAEDIYGDLGTDAETVAPRFTPQRALWVTKEGEAEARPLGASGNGVVPGLVEGIGGFRVVEGEYFRTPDDPFSVSDRYLEGNYTPDAFSDEAFQREVVVNRALAGELDVGPGDRVVLSTSQSFGDNVTLVVRGVYEADFEGTEHRSFHFHLSQLQYMLQRFDDPVSEILVTLAEGVDTEGTRQALENDFEYSPRLTVSTDRDIYNRLDVLYQTFEGFARLIALITIAVALLFIFTVMIISVKERIREIGALRALGFSRLSVFRMIVWEGLLISLAGFAFGLVFGFLDAWVLDYFLTRTLTNVPAGIHVTEITWLVVLEVTLVGVVIGAVAGLLPAYWATRVDIAKALRHD